MEQDIKTIKTILLVFGAIVIIYLLHVLAILLIPLALALFLAMLLQPVLAWFERKKWPFSLSLTVISITTVSLLALIGLIIYQTGVSLVDQKAKLLNQINLKLAGIFNWVHNLFGLEINPDEITGILGEVMSSDWILKSSGAFADMLGDFTGMFFMTSLYLIALIGGILKYEGYLNYLEEGDPDKESTLLMGFEQVKSSISTYIKIKFLVSFFTGLCFWLVCLLFGLDFAIFWGFLAFVLNFIPTVGSIIATIPPVLLGIVQLDSLEGVLSILALLIVVQIIFGNIVEPKLMGSSLALNTITVILGLVFWGYVWGVAGMILSVPLLVLSKVILTQFSEAQILVRLMGVSGIRKK